jgi:hypothetical protein
MVRVAAVFSALGSGLGGIAAFAFVALQIGLFVGGISYRKDCLAESGAVKSSWSFTWFAPIPYIFRPTEEGCEVHTGTRVALNAAGVTKYASASTRSLASKIAKQTASPDLAYFGQLKAVLVELQRQPDARTVAEGQKNLQVAVDALNDLTPTTKYEVAHGGLVTTLGQMLASTGTIAAAHDAGQDAAQNRGISALQRQSSRLDGLVSQINRLHATD